MSNETSAAFACDSYKPTWRDWFRHRLFPYRHCQLPEAPAVYADSLTIHTFVSLSFKDRLRVILTGRLEVTTRTVTESIIGQSVTASECYVLPPRILEARKEF